METTERNFGSSVKPSFNPIQSYTNNTSTGFYNSNNNEKTNTTRSMSYAPESISRWQENNMYRTSYYDQSRYNVSKLIKENFLILTH